MKTVDVLDQSFDIFCTEDDEGETWSSQKN